MEYLHLTSAMEEIESTPSRSEKVSIAAKLFSTTQEPLLADIVRLLVGQVTAPWRGEFMGANVHTVSTVLCEVSGFSVQRFLRLCDETGGLGEAALILLTRRVQSTLSPAPLDCADVHALLCSIAAHHGDGAQSRKTDILRALFTRSEPGEAKYLVRTVLGRSPCGLSLNLAEDAIAAAFKVPRESVQRASSMLPDPGEVAIHARDGTLDDVSLELFRPLRPRYMQPIDELNMGDVQGRLLLQARYGGVYIQVHKLGGRVRVFTRGLWEVGESLVELVPVFKNMKAGSMVLEGELVAVKTGSRTGSPVPPYIDVSHRLGRKYHHDSMMRNFPLRFYAADIAYLNGDDLTGLRTSHRHRYLRRLARRSELELLPVRVTGSTSNAEKFISNAVSEGARSVAAVDNRAPWMPSDGGRYLLRLPAGTGKKLI